ncbi:MAG: hypothetical protein C4567_18150 [Deltaproteobacteria bacterium]|nr:MAG: hypothetical protein C4567_18150 [Deltaproteobacteria bacterium]
MGEKKPQFLEDLKEKILSGEEKPAPEIPKKYCNFCESETATWAFCDQCGRLFWGRIAWDLASGGICAGLGTVMLLKTGTQFYEKVLAVLIGAAGLWVMARIMRQLWQAYGFRKSRQSR